MTILFSLYILGTVAYCIFILFIIVGLNRLNAHKYNHYQPFVSVIIPARNEENNIKKSLRALVNQTYPQNLYEMIVVDDLSGDNTNKIVRDFAADHDNITLLSLSHNDSTCSPKKQAIEAGVLHSKGEIIFTTDADCVVPANWIEIMLRYFDKNTGLVASWLLVNPEKSLLSKLESLDSLGLVMVGAASFGLGIPFLANGANLAYRKSLFNNINGFQGINQYASGDDDLLLQKIIKQSKYKAVFAPDYSSIVSTHANHNLKDFLQQRIRWASKSRTYPLPILVFEIIIYLYFLLLLFSIPFIFISIFPLLFLLIKLILDFILIKIGCKKINRPLPVLHFLLANFFQMSYILIVSIAGLFGKFKWKNRLYAKGKIVTF